MRASFVLALVAALSASPTIAAEAGMSGAELHALLDGGKVLKLGGKGTGYSGQLTLNADGTGSGSAKTDDGKNEFKLVGTWAIKGDEFCRTWRDVDKGKEVCETWVKSGANRVKVMVKGKQVGVNRW